MKSPSHLGQDTHKGFQFMSYLHAGLEMRKMALLWNYVTAENFRHILSDKA